MAAVWRSQCAFARIFGGKCRQFLNNATDIGARLTPASQSGSAIREYSSYSQSPFVSKIKEQYDFEIVKNPPEWEYVQRLMPFEAVPPLIPKSNYPSGFIPPKEEAKDLPFFIHRTKNHQIPIYLKITHRGLTKITTIKKIDGDIWLMNSEIKEHLKAKSKRYVETRVHELGRFIEVKGDFVHYLQEWAYSKGF